MQCNHNWNSSSYLWILTNWFKSLYKEAKDPECCSVAKSSLTLCDPMNCSMQDFPVLYHFPEFAQLMFIESVVLSNHLILCQPPLFSLQSFPTSGSFPISWLLTSGGQSIGASASVLPVNIQGWFPLGLIGLILLCKGLSRAFSSTTIQKHQFFGCQPSFWSNTHICT